MNDLEHPGCRHDNGPPGEASIPTTDLTCMTPRQRTIARLIARGHTNQEIGVEVNLDRAAVAEEVEHLRAALGLGTRLQIAVLAMGHDPGGDHGDTRREAAMGWDDPTR
jgi:DNA-binding NarL/FixJ family response regulator